MRAGVLTVGQPQQCVHISVVERGMGEHGQRDVQRKERKCHIGAIEEHSEVRLLST